MRMKTLPILGFGLLLLLSACAPSRLVKPLAKQQKAVNASLGGPLVHFSGLVIPTPFTTVSGAYGLTDKTTVFAGLHPTAMLFGVFQMDAGFVQQLLAQKAWRPGLTMTPAVNFATNGKDTKLWPNVDVNAFWNYKQKPDFFYAGMSTWFETASTKAFGETQPQHVFPNIQLGHSWVHPKADYQLELKYLGPGLSNRDIVVDYVGVDRKGAIGVYFSFTKKF